MLAQLAPLGWTFMLVSTLSVTSLVIWCFKKVLGGPPDQPEPPSHVGLGP